MSDTKKVNLNEPRFTDDNAAREFLESVRWPNGPVCPHCGGVERISRIERKSESRKGARPGLLFCGDCREQFTVTVGTVLERSKIPLHKWVLANHLLCSSKKGMSSKQIERMLGVTYKTAWFMTHRLREAMNPSVTVKIGSGGGTVEADETYYGNKPGRKIGRGMAHKHAIFSLVERNGNVRSFHVPNVTAETLKPIMQAHMDNKAHLMTDDAGQYRILGPVSASHGVINHSSKEYVRGNVHTNTVEGFFSLLKRGIYGTFHSVSEQHLQRYVNEFDFRYNYRQKKVKVGGKWHLTGYSDTERAEMALKGISGKRLTYRRINRPAH
jgi:transposase-like protein